MDDRIESIKRSSTDRQAPGEEPPSLTHRTILTLLYARTLGNMAFRVLYPFLPAIARGLDVSLEAAGRLVSVQGGVRVAAPLFGHLSDRYGRRRMMEVALLILIAATSVVFFTGAYPAALIAFAGIGLARALYDPTVQAYVGDMVPYDRRARPFALISMAWALSWLFGVPAGGWIIERWGWRTPWGVIALLLVTALVGTHLFVPSASHVTRPTRSYTAFTWRELLARSHIRAALVTGFGIVFAVENVFVVYGAFLEQRFALSVGAIGIVSIVVGLSELLAEGSTFAWTDRLGKKRSVIFGLVAFGVALLWLPFLSGALVPALAGFALVFFCFEFTIVSFFPLVSELAADARATAISLNVASMGLARLMAPLVGTFLFARVDALLPNALLSALVCLASAGVLWRGVEK